MGRGNYRKAEEITIRCIFAFKNRGKPVRTLIWFLFGKEEWERQGSRLKGKESGKIPVLEGCCLPLPRWGGGKKRTTGGI